MKNNLLKRGFVVPLTITFVVLLTVSVGVYVYVNKSSVYPQKEIIPGPGDTTQEKTIATSTVIKPSTPTVKVATIESLNSVINANNQFAFEMYSKLKKDNENLFFSPYSLSSALAMTYEGVKGKTAEEIQKVFHFPVDDNTRRSGYATIYNQINTTNSKYKFSIANALWIQNDYKILDEYINTIKNYYFGIATNLDFANKVEASRLTINKWVEDQTNNKIKNLFPAGTLDSTTRLVLTNAVYFKGSWVKPFKKDQTTDEDFSTFSGSIKVPMMQMTDSEAKFNYVENDTLQALEMPYEGDKLSMVIILPKSKDLTSFEDGLSLKLITDLKNQMLNNRVDIFIPKFTFDTKYDMEETLGKMGMTNAFSSSADFSGLDGTKNLYIQKVIHQAFVDVNEEGTEAAAATGVAIALTSFMPPEEIPVFRANHPFIFIIQDKTNSNILFIGKVVNPIK